MKIVITVKFGKYLSKIYLKNFIYHGWHNFKRCV